MEQYYTSPQPFIFRVKHAWLVIGLYLAVTLIVTFPVGLLEAAIVPIFGQLDWLKDWILLVTTVITYAILFFILYYFFKQFYSSQPLLELSRVDGMTYLLLLFVILSFAITIEPIVSWLAKIPMPKFIEEAMAIMTKASIPFFIMAVIVAPLCEELLLRGTILRGLLTSINPWKAIVWTAFLFALIHMNPAQGFTAFTIGILLGWIYWKTRSLWTCIFVHFVNNAFAFICIAIAGPEKAAIATFQSLTGLSPVLVYGTSATVLALSGYLLWRKYRRVG